MIVAAVHRPLTAAMGTKWNGNGAIDESLLAMPLMSEKHGTSTGPQTQFVAASLKAQKGRGWSHDCEASYVAAPLTFGAHPNSNAPGRRKEDDVNLVATLGGGNYGQGNQQEGVPNCVPVAFNLRGREQGNVPELAEQASVRSAGGGSTNTHVAIPIKECASNQWSKGNEPGACGPGIGDDGDPMYALGSTPSNMHGVAVLPTLTSANDPSRSPQAQEVTQQVAAVAGSGFGVRRLTPTECERLQGFPDGWTEGFADSRRYAMLGNAVAVPVAEWIGRRLAGVTGTLEGM